MGRLRPSRHCSWGGAGRTACPWYRGVQGRVEALVDLLGVDKAGNVPGLQLADVLLGQPVQVSCDVGGLPCLEGLSRSTVMRKAAFYVGPETLEAVRGGASSSP